MSGLEGMLRRHLQPTAEQAAKQAPTYMLAVLVLTALYGLVVLGDAYATPYTAAIDTRQHVYWMRRFLDPGLFPGDPHTDYFQTVAPYGYVALYKVLAWLGVDPLDASKLLPIPLALATSYFCFRVGLQLVPVPLAAFIASLALAQYAWMHPDISTGTPRAFLLPMFVAFLDRLLARDPRGLAIATWATGATYPPYLLVELTLLGMWPWGWRGRPTLRAAPRLLAGYAVSAAIALITLAFYAAKTHQFGPVATGDVARGMIEFQEGGFRAFFYKNPVSFWLACWSSAYAENFYRGTVPAAMALALAAPAWWALGRPAPGHPVVTERAWDLVRVWVGVTGLYFLAHATVFLLYEPSRYTSYSVAVLVALVAGICAPRVALTLVDGLANASSPHARWCLAPGLVAFAILAVGDPRVPTRASYLHGPSPGLYRFLATTPRDARIATLSKEATHVGMFARRQVLVASTLNPYHLGYYLPVRQATRDLLAAQYATDLHVVARFARAHGVSHLVLDRQAFTVEYTHSNEWMDQFGVEAARIRRDILNGAEFVLAHPKPRWISYESPELVVLDAAAIMRAVGTP